MNGIETSVLLGAFVLLAAGYYYHLARLHDRQQALINKLVELMNAKTYSEWAQGQRTLARGVAEMSGKKVKEPSDPYSEMAKGFDVED